MTDRDKPLGKLASQQSSLPKTVDAFKCCQQLRIIEAPLALSAMPRLLEQMGTGQPSEESDVKVVLRFERDDEGYRVIRGRIESMLAMICQRCLEPVLESVNVEFSCAFVMTDEQAKALPAHLEPVMLEENSHYVNLHELLEDELLLSLPITAFHDSCDGDGSTRTFGELSCDAENELESSDVKEKPFASALSAFLNKQNSNE